MSQVTKGLLLFGYLAPLASHIVWTNVTPGSVWHFWLDNNKTHSNLPSRVRIQFVDTFRHGNAHRAEIYIGNTSNVGASYALRWSCVYN